MAHIALRLDLFKLVIRLLEPFEVELESRLSNAVDRAHFCHLLGFARVATNSMVGGCAVLKRGLRWVEDENVEWACPLHSMIELTRSFDGPLLDRIEEEEPANDIAQLIAACVRHDTLQEASDDEGAFSAIDRPVVWANRELFSLSRLAGAFLNRDPDPQWATRRRLALTQLMAANQEWRTGRVAEVPHPRLRVGRSAINDRVSEIEAEGSSWTGYTPS